ncbi:MAG: hypothetical protein PVS2B2_13480 [Candidatus Acidiferrum sp.]
MSLAIAMGCALLVPGVYLLRFVTEWDQGWWIRGNLALALLMQPLLIVAAILVYKSLPSEPREHRLFWGSSVYGVVLFGLFGLPFLFHPLIPRQISDNESYAIERLREGNNSALLYADKFEGFYPENGAPLGQDLTEPEKKLFLTHDSQYGYIFEYRSVAADSPVRGSRVARSYTISARPASYHSSGMRSFLLLQPHPGKKRFQEYYIHIHVTPQDRPATASDPVEEVETFTYGYD